MSFTRPLSTPPEPAGAPSDQPVPEPARAPSDPPCAKRDGSRERARRLDVPPRQRRLVPPSWPPTASATLAVLERLGPTLLAAALGLVYVIVSPPSEDLPAHLLRAKLFSAEGFGLWNNWWYAGHHTPGYSVLFPPLAAALTPQVVGALAATATAAVFEALTRAHFGRRAWLGALWFGGATAVDLFTGRLPFALGLLFAVATALALQRRRDALAGSLAFLSSLASPVAALFTALAGVAGAAGRYQSERRRAAAMAPLAVAALALVPVLGLSLVFPEGGSEPYALSAMLPIVATGAVALLTLGAPQGLGGARTGTLQPGRAWNRPRWLGGSGGGGQCPAQPPTETHAPGGRAQGPAQWPAEMDRPGGRRQRPAQWRAGFVGPSTALCAGIVLYVVGNLISYWLVTPVGSNASRLEPLLAGPLAALIWWPRRKAWLLAAALPLLYIQWQAPVRDVRTSWHDRGTTAVYYRPLLRFLSHQPGAPFRIEIPFTAFHWEAYEVAPRFPLARGWERQLDRKDNPLFYDGQLTATTYEEWLHTMAARYVAVARGPVDYAARDELALIRRGLPYLRLVMRTRDWSIYAVRDPTPLSQGAATVTGMGADSVSLRAKAPGSVLVRVHFTPYWALSGVSGCVAPAGQFTRVELKHAGTAHLVIRFSLSRIGATSPRCA